MSASVSDEFVASARKKCDPLAEFFFEGLTFLSQEIAKNYFGTFFDETSDDSFADSSGTAGNDGNLIV
jgi:hypothetical protein